MIDVFWKSNYIRNRDEEGIRMVLFEDAYKHFTENVSHMCLSQEDFHSISRDLNVPSTMTVIENHEDRSGYQKAYVMVPGMYFLLKLHSIIRFE